MSNIKSIKRGNSGKIDVFNTLVMLQSLHVLYKYSITKQLLKINEKI